MRKVMVFGVFDRFHEGHRHFLRQAKTEGDWLVAVVTPDHIVHELKGYLPEEHVGDRMEVLHREGLADRVVMGDPELGTWHVVRQHRPHCIVLGYDQGALQEEIERAAGNWNWFFDVLVVRPHKPETHHSSIHRTKNSRDKTPA